MFPIVRSLDEIHNRHSTREIHTDPDFTTIFLVPEAGDEEAVRLSATIGTFTRHVFGTRNRRSIRVVPPRKEVEGRIDLLKHGDCFTEQFGGTGVLVEIR